ncbi:MAG TPA: ABC transporter permease [Candidatus Limnocylindrales bacterium]|nr:ABC transporter permease [Candidatus Limnocylindrales bacterium]
MTVDSIAASTTGASRTARTAAFLAGRKIGLFGLAILGALIGIAILAPIIAPYDPNVRTGLPFEAPSQAHPLGTNDIGQDLLSELIFGTRISLLVGAIAAIGAVGIGTLVGVIAGYFGGLVDQVLMRVADGVLIMPFLPLMIVLAAFAGPSVANLVIIIALVWWPQTARIVRSRALTLRSRGFVDAARGLGASNLRIMSRYLLPLTLPLGLAQFVYVAAQTILIEASLSFLGLGDPTAETWGSMLYWAQARGAFLNESWQWWVVPPGLAISVTVIGFTYAGYLLEDLLDPRLRRR